MTPRVAAGTINLLIAQNSFQSRTTLRGQPCPSPRPYLPKSNQTNLLLIERHTETSWNIATERKNYLHAYGASFPAKRRSLNGGQTHSVPKLLSRLRLHLQACPICLINISHWANNYRAQNAMWQCCCNSCGNIVCIHNEEYSIW